MLNSTTWLYGAEVLPINLRSKVMGLAATSHFVVNVASTFSAIATPLPSTPSIFCVSTHSDGTPAVTEAGPSAFATIHENYYYVFVACSLFFLVLAYLYFPETKLKSLEEIAAVFGDKVVLLTQRDVDAEEAVLEGKMGAEFRERDEAEGLRDGER